MTTFQFWHRQIVEMCMQKRSLQIKLKKKTFFSRKRHIKFECLGKKGISYEHKKVK
jgi:hypothetical protein